MTSVAAHNAPARQFSEGPYATTTAWFDDASLVTATAWQGKTVPVSPGWKGLAAKLLAPSAVSLTLAVSSPVVDANEAGQTASVNAAPNDFERDTVGIDATIPEEGVYAPARPRRVLYSEVVEFQTDTLPRRKPRISGDDSFLAILDDE